MPSSAVVIIKQNLHEVFCACLDAPSVSLKFDFIENEIQSLSFGDVCCGTRSA
jgi:hypothetical protein